MQMHVKNILFGLRRLTDTAVIYKKKDRSPRVGKHDDYAMQFAKKSEIFLFSKICSLFNTDTIFSTKVKL